MQTHSPGTMRAVPAPPEGRRRVALDLDAALWKRVKQHALNQDTTAIALVSRWIEEGLTKEQEQD